jgi:hypothetical protein
LGEAGVPEREVILVMTYLVVVFSILVQGLTIGPLIRRWLGDQASVRATWRDLALAGCCGRHAFAFVVGLDGARLLSWFGLPMAPLRSQPSRKT